jgi:hypothetical protein
MKKIRLVGKKLYRVGPLKCYKDNHHGHGSGGVYSSNRPQGYGSGSGGGTYMSTGGSTSTFSFSPEVIERMNKEIRQKTATKVVFDPVYGTAIKVTPAEYETAVKTGAVPGKYDSSGNPVATGDPVKKSGELQRKGSEYLDQFKTEAEKEEDARKKREIEIEIEEMNKDFDKAKDARAWYEKVGDVLETGHLAAYSDEFVANVEKRKRKEYKRNAGIDEARRLGRPVVMDGYVYKPGMTTTGEQQRLSDAAQKFDVTEEYIRDLGYTSLNMSDAELRDAIDQSEKMAAGFGMSKEQLAAQPSFQDPDTGKMLKMGDPGYKNAKSAYSSRLQQKWEDRIRKRQALMEKARLGTLDKDDRTKLDALSKLPGMGKYVNLLNQGLDIGEVVSKELSGPVGFTEASEAEAEEQERIQGGVNEEPQRVEDVTDPELKKTIKTFNLDKMRKGSTDWKPTDVGDIPMGPIKPGGDPIPSDVPPTNLNLQQQLEKRARGEDLIAEKEGKLARERGLAQQLASIRGARGVTAGQRLRALQRGGEKLTTELGAKTAIEKAKEQKEAQDRIIDLEEAEKGRQQAAGIGAYKDAKPGVSAAAPAPKKSWLTQAVDTAQDLKQAWDVGTDIYDSWKKKKKKAEGGFVSGPGTETSDSIPARLSDGEFVVKSSAVRGLGKAMGAKDKKEERKKGVDFLYELQDKMDKVEKRAEGGEIKADPERFLKFMDKGVNYSLMKKRIQKAKISKKEKEKLLKGLGKEPKFAKGGEAYVRPKKAFREAIGYEAESRFHDKAAKDAKFGGARRKFRHFQDGGPVDMKGPGMIKEQFKMPSAGGYGSVVAAQGDLQRRIEELERKMGK